MMFVGAQVVEREYAGSLTPRLYLRGNTFFLHAGDARLGYRLIRI